MERLFVVLGWQVGLSPGPCSQANSTATHVLRKGSIKQVEISFENLFPRVSMNTLNSQPKCFRNEKALFKLYTLLW